MLISTRCIHDFMSNLIKKPWADSNIQLLLTSLLLFLKHTAKCWWFSAKGNLYPIKTVTFSTFKATRPQQYACMIFIIIFSTLVHGMEFLAKYEIYMKILNFLTLENIQQIYRIIFSQTFINALQQVLNWKLKSIQCFVPKGLIIYSSFKKRKRKLVESLVLKEWWNLILYDVL